MTLRDFRDQVRAAIPDTFGWDFYTTSTPNEEYLCASGYVYGFQVIVSYCGDFYHPYEMTIGDARQHGATTLKQAVLNALDGLDKAAVVLRKELACE